ncbi:MAG: hypothetical protein LBJ03_02510 [Holosporales bacterium]|nr:hypothetical protein [Holosporales bacterium]
MEYGYTKRDLLKDKENYQYSRYYGEEFLESYFKQRSGFLCDLEKLDCVGNCFGADPIGTLAFLKDFSDCYPDVEIYPDAGFALMLKRFEVTKRIYDLVDENFRPLEGAVCDNLNLYAAFSYCCCLAYEKTRHLSFLNALLKCNDIISSQGNLNGADVLMLEKIVNKELKYVRDFRSHD